MAAKHGLKGVFQHLIDQLQLYGMIVLQNLHYVNDIFLVKHNAFGFITKILIGEAPETQ